MKYIWLTFVIFQIKNSTKIDEQLWLVNRIENILMSMRILVRNGVLIHAIHTNASRFDSRIDGQRCDI